MAKIKTFKNISSISAIGIDVSRDTLDICLLRTDGGSEEYLRIKNERKPVERLAKNLAGYQGKTIMESTGRHHLLAAIILSAKDQDVRVVNPLLTGKYVKSSIRKVKTDRRDAKVLALMALLEENLPESFSADEITANIRKKISLVAFLDKQLQQLSSSLNDYAKTKSILNAELSAAERGIIETIAELKAEKESLEDEIKSDLNDADQGDQERIDRLSTIPGVSVFIAAVSSFLFSVDHLEDPKQWIAYSGLDISVRQSGIWNGHGKLTKRGNPFIRKKLFQAAWGAIMNNQNFRDYYDFLKKEKGRKHTEALTIIARKMIRIMFSLTKNNTVFEPQKFKFCYS